MEFDEEQKTSRVVVDTPQARREIVQTETTRGEERRGISTGAVAAVIVAAVALTAIAFMFLMNRNTDPVTDQRASAVATLAPAAPPQTTVIQQPAVVPPTTIIQQAAPTQAPVVLPPVSVQPTPMVDDGLVQSNVSNAIMNDSELATSDIQVTVLNAEATITGNVNTVELKRRAERLAKAVKGVKKINNKISVIGAEDAGTAPKTLP